MGGTICSLDLGGVNGRSGGGGGARPWNSEQTPVVDPCEQPGGRVLLAELEFVCAPAEAPELNSPNTKKTALHIGIALGSLLKNAGRRARCFQALNCHS
jgi:hypothetical protein